ncbi:histone deacetylase complex subunit SAP30 homolog isoform X2 [Diorhabda carinulata]|uniref:histone deacetylase complex subunit SAP30 homolog isoform X2 n=1 Tax=Diorhabda sublineata TaxID=1163346 RepID=UPI0024E1682A|nr:histone deacetylase complex subunit SAP30 homolog isoform X2 [Diorhabda sublineata]XP_057659444.1 histone deacetylase complex subunit SAP30 homolog isoform X2 [Diorhabda carinulata]
MNGFSTGEEDSRGPTDQICCLIDNSERCTKPAGNASYSKKIQKTAIQRRLNFGLDSNARHNYICDYHKMIIQCARTKRRRKDSEDDSNETDTDVPEVDLFQLQVNTLRRYKRHYKVPMRQGLNKAQLADTLMKHFKTISVKEKEVVTFFIYTVKTNANKLDQKNGINNDTT